MVARVAFRLAGSLQLCSSYACIYTPDRYTIHIYFRKRLLYIKQHLLTNADHGLRIKRVTSDFCDGDSFWCQISEGRPIPIADRHWLLAWETCLNGGRSLRTVTCYGLMLSEVGSKTCLVSLLHIHVARSSSDRGTCPGKGSNLLRWRIRTLGSLTKRLVACAVEWPQTVHCFWTGSGTKY